MFDCIKRDVSEDACIICSENKGEMKSYSDQFGCKCERNFFHQTCWEKYRKTFNTCPLCRKKVIPPPEGVIIDIPPSRERTTIEERLGRYGDDSPIFLCCYTIVNFPMWMGISTLLAVGLYQTQYNTSTVYIVSIANGFVALYEIIATLSDCFYCHFGMFRKLLKGRHCLFMFYKILACLRFITLVFTMVEVRSTEAGGIRVAFILIIVHFIFVALCVFCAMFAFRS